jgi:predicted PurR-regulated permease PerM
MQKLSGSLQTYESNLLQISKSIESYIGIDIQSSITSFSGDIDFKSEITKILNSLTDLLSSSFMIVLYLIFILLEESSFIHKLKAIYPEEDKYETVNNILLKVDKSIGSYISIKTLISGLTATLSYVILILIGIDSALFFAFLIFILNFIPSVGSLIATVFPALMALLQYGNTTFTPFILVVVFVGSVQVIVGNFLEPKLMGNSLNISSLVVILSLTIWGAIWGVIGMVLSVPITVIMIIIFSNFENTKKIAILLSEKGKINVKG